jgi:hypothetical protein
MGVGNDCRQSTNREVLAQLKVVSTQEQFAKSRIWYGSGRIGFQWVSRCRISVRMTTKRPGPPFEPGTKPMICTIRVFLVGIHGVLLRPPKDARYYASAVGVEGGSDCVGATRERDRLCLAFGSAAASVTSDFDLERRVRRGWGLVSTCSSIFAAAGSAVAGADGTAVTDFRPSPSSLASVERCSEYAGAVRG